MLKDKINRYVENLCKKAFVASKSAALNTSADRNNILKCLYILFSLSFGISKGTKKNKDSILSDIILFVFSIFFSFFVKRKA